MSKKPREPYFGKHVNDAIVEYSNPENTPVHKTKLFNTIIYPALNKLAENVIHNSKFYNYGIDGYADVKHDLVVYLHERLNKYSLEKGRAFSYFNTISLNWVRANMRRVSDEAVGMVELQTIDDERDILNEVSHADYLDELRDFCVKWADWGDEHLDYFFFIKNGRIVPFLDRDKKIANAIFDLFRNCKYLDIYEKKALYILIREQVEVKTQYITDVVNVLKKLYKEMYVEYKQSGTKYWHRHLYYPDEYCQEPNNIEEM